MIAHGKMQHQWDGDNEAKHAKEIAHQAVKRLRAARNEQERQRANRRREQHHAEEMMRKKLHANRLSAQTAH